MWFRMRYLTILDSRMVRKGCEDRAIEVMERMKAAGVRPNVVL